VLAQAYPTQVKELKEFIATEDLFPLVTVDNNIKSNKLIIRRSLA
jgi:hypothetical protein